jgi:hypothetical protein
MKTIALSAIAEIFTGIVLPKSKNEFEESPFDKIPKTKYRIINISDIDNDGDILKSLMEMKLDSSERIEKYSVKYGDILISSRGTRLKTAVVPISIKDNTLISSNLMCIRLTKDSNYPSEILNFFLRSDYGENSLKRLSSSSGGVVNLNQKVLGMLQVPHFEDRDERDKISDAVNALIEMKSLFAEQRRTFLILEKALEAKYLEKYEDKSD